MKQSLIGVSMNNKYEQIEVFSRMSNLLRSNSYFTRLVILQCHEDVHYCGLENTLNRVRCYYWVVKERQTVKKKIVLKFICKAIQVKWLLPPSTDKLPDYRIHFEFPFEHVGLDYADPLYIGDIYPSKKYMNPKFLF